MTSKSELAISVFQGKPMYTVHIFILFIYFLILDAALCLTFFAILLNLQTLTV